MGFNKFIFGWDAKCVYELDSGGAVEVWMCLSSIMTQMATSSFPATIPRPTTGWSVTSFRHLPTNPAPFFLSPPNCKTEVFAPLKTNDRRALKCVARLRSKAREEGPPNPTTFDAQQLVDFLYKDLRHVFDDQGIDRTAYDERMKFRDPITKHDSISGYLFNISMLRKLFNPDLQLHWVKQTGTYEITTRWTVVMKFIISPWKPEFVLTGTSVMGINPDTNKFCSHTDYWDSVENNDYFSVEGLLDMIKRLRIYKTPDLETPKYQILKRTADYEVRKYEPFIVVETNGDKLPGSSGFNSVAGYIFGKNSASEKTPVFTQSFDPDISKVSVQIVLPSEKDINSLPAPNEAEIRLRKAEGGITAVSKFSGKPTEDIVRDKEKCLRSNLVRDGLKTKTGCLLARYNDPGRTWSFIMRNEVLLIWVEEFAILIKLHPTLLMAAIHTASVNT